MTRYYLKYNTLKKLVFKLIGLRNSIFSLLKSSIINLRKSVVQNKTYRKLFK